MRRTVFAGGSVFDGTGSGPAPADVAIDGDRIVDIGSGLDGDEAIDCAGLTLLPGMVDAHVHVTTESVDTVRVIEQPVGIDYYIAEANLGRILDCGITSVRDASGADLAIKTAVDRGMIEGPRMRIAITMIGQTGGHSDKLLASGCYLGTQGRPGRPFGVVDGPEEVRKKVREIIRAGGDQIKVAASGGVMSPRDNPRHAHLQPDELEMAVREAAQAGTYVMAHAQATEGIKNAVRAGVRSIEHGIFLDDEAIEMMLKAGTWLVPTLLAPVSLLEASASGSRLTEASQRKVQEIFEPHRRSFRRAVDAGVRVAMGTDAVGFPMGQNLRELELMREHGGMKPAAVLSATTRSGAELLGLGDDLGELAPGKRADIVAIEGDPYSFTDLKERVRFVFKDGRRIRGTAARATRGRRHQDREPITP